MCYAGPAHRHTHPAQQSLLSTRVRKMDAIALMHHRELYNVLQLG